MFSTSSYSKVTVACVAMMMMMMVMMMMTEGAAVTRHSARAHKKSTDSAVIRTVPLQLDPHTFPHVRGRPLQNSSISPWTYNDTHDESLYPPVLREARCLLQGCLNSEGQEDLNLHSRPIMHQVLVLRRVRSLGNEPGSDSSYHFRLESRQIAVGCTCVRPNYNHGQQ